MLILQSTLKIEAFFGNWFELIACVALIELVLTVCVSNEHHLFGLCALCHSEDKSMLWYICNFHNFTFFCLDKKVGFWYIVKNLSVRPLASIRYYWNYLRIHLE